MNKFRLILTCITKFILFKIVFWKYNGKKIQWINHNHESLFIYLIIRIFILLKKKGLK
jgi:hypothetical protein